MFWMVWPMHGKQVERRPGLWPLLCSGAELGAYLHQRQPSWLVHEPVQPMPADTLKHGQVQASSQVQLHELSSSSERFHNMVWRFCTVYQGFCGVTLEHAGGSVQICRSRVVP